MSDDKDDVAGSHLDETQDVSVEKPDVSVDSQETPPSNDPSDPRQKLFAPLLALSAVALLLIGAVGGALWGMNNASDNGAAPAPSPTSAPAPAPTNGPEPAPDPTEPPKPDIAVPKGSAGWGEPIILGDPNARSVTVVEDMTCPFCAIFHKDTLEISQEAINSGKANIQYYVVAFFGEGAFTSAEAVSCAADQDAFTSYSSLLYANQKPDRESFTDEELVTFAEDPTSGISDVAAFTQCVTDGTYADYVESVTSVAQAAGVPGTPSVYADGQLIDPNFLSPQVFADLLNGTPADQIGPRPLG